MNKTVLLVAITVLTSCTIFSQSKKKKDRNAIKEMSGCFEVTFNFAETFKYTKNANYTPSKTKMDKGLEWAQVIVDENNKISIQHLLQVGNPTNPHIVKHWRQDWLYQNQNFYTYTGNNTWNYSKKSKKEVKNQWTQKVYQVDDSPRYEGSGTWVHVDGKSYWENTTNAPLPRREYTQRSDYNITSRGNRHEITNDGWVHDQNNDKVLRVNNKEEIIAKEKGYNTYVKVADSKCKASQEWWNENAQKWQLVRNKWDAIYSRNNNLTLKNKVNNKMLYKYLFSDEITKENEMDEIIESFVKK
ncbi:DUF6607 family protein [Mesoflavibacter zeaxanthinifaciens]|uniref:DUF6607 family protein n=1 Tax=Mesoflavibacter zeaxanthinifaciens TaxID=393060 RepID=UPI003A95A86A